MGPCVTSGEKREIFPLVEKDPDLKSLHGDPRFEALVAHAKERAAAQKLH